MPTHIPLTRGVATLIDDDDYARLAAHRWHCTANGYAARVVVHPDGKKQTIYMHRFLLDAPPDLQVDHINGDKLDNRRENLRLATPKENVRNGRSSPKRNTYKGVTRAGNRWQARICVDGRIRHLGYHTSALEASFIYDHAARRFFGAFAHLNHPEIPALAYFDGLLDQILAGTRPPRKPTRKPRITVPKARSYYRGVHWERGRWRATLCVRGNKQHLGYFTSERDAALAYDAAAKAQLGDEARLNFPS